MPEIKTVVEKVENLRRGDVISTQNDGTWPYGSTVETVRPATKWTVVRDPNGHLIRRIENGTRVSVDRMVDTAEEAAVKQRAMAIRLLQNWMEEQNKGYKKAIADLTDRLAADPVNVSADHLYERVEKARVAITFCRNIEKVLSAGQYGDLVDCAIYVLNDMVRMLLRGQYDPNSRSLSFHDACQWTEHQTMRSIINQMGYTIKYDMGGIL